MNTPVAQSDMTFEEMNQIIWQHLIERDWGKAGPRGLAISIALEANELLEHFQWEEKAIGDKQALADELADVLIYAFQFAQNQDIDIAEAMRHKLAKAAQKYPAEMFKNKSKTEIRQAWIDAKTTYKKEGL
jgi:NTP pyrophosphatase (non-canonical NTP hydrolase)